MATNTVSKTNYTMKVDVATRDAFNTLCDQIGISMSSALNAMMKQAVREQRMNFSLYDENGFTYEEAKEFRKRALEMERGVKETHDLIEA